MYFLEKVMFGAFAFVLLAVGTVTVMLGYVEVKKLELNQGKNRIEITTGSK